MTIKETLRSFGLSEKEVNTYLAALELGPTTATKLSMRTGILRPTTHHICKYLLQKGFLSAVEKGKLIIFTAAPPQKLLYLLEKERKNIDDREVAVNRVMRDLEKITNPSTILPKVKFYEGGEGIQEALRDFQKGCTEPGEILSYARDLTEPKGKDRFLAECFQEALKERIDKKVLLRAIVLFSEEALNYKKGEKENLRNVYLTYDHNFPFTFGKLYIYQDRICAISLESSHYFAFLVQNKNLAEMQKGMFELAWQQAQRDNAEICTKVEVKKGLK